MERETSFSCACPLCAHMQTAHFFSDRRRDFFQCSNCSLVFVPKSFHLSADDERAEYMLHQNSPQDQGYRQFLSRLWQPMVERLPENKADIRGLDFGCGPGPTLSVMFEELGVRMSVYDKFFADDKGVLSGEYNFVTSTEVVEHLSEPLPILDQMWSLTKPGGMLGVMTKLVRDQKAFSGWHYKNDQTHVVFYSKRTLEWLAARWQAKLEFVASDAFIFLKAK